MTVRIRGAYESKMYRVRKEGRSGYGFCPSSRGWKFRACVTGNRESETNIRESCEISVRQRRSQDKLTWRRDFVSFVLLHLVIFIGWNGDVIPQSPLASSGPWPTRHELIHRISVLFRGMSE